VVMKIFDANRLTSSPECHRDLIASDVFDSSLPLTT